MRQARHIVPKLEEIRQGQQVGATSAGMVGLWEELVLTRRLWSAARGLEADSVQQLKFDISAALEMSHKAPLVHADLHRQGDN